MHDFLVHSTHSLLERSCNIYNGATVQNVSGNVQNVDDPKNLDKIRFEPFRMLAGLFEKVSGTVQNVCGTIQSVNRTVQKVRGTVQNDSGKHFLLQFSGGKRSKFLPKLFIKGGPIYYIRQSCVQSFLTDNFPHDFFFPSTLAMRNNL